MILPEEKVPFCSEKASPCRGGSRTGSAITIIPISRASSRFSSDAAGAGTRDDHCRHSRSGHSLTHLGKIAGV